MEYCPMTASRCSYRPFQIKRNQFFLIQPFDDDKVDREKAIKNALKKVFNDKYNFASSEEQITTNAIFCDICKKIAQSQYCIVDITPKRINSELVIRANVPLELGLSYGHNKPTFIISKKIDGERKIPSDISFARYIDNDNDYDDWTELEYKLVSIFKDVGLGNLKNEEILLRNSQLLHDFIKLIKMSLTSIRNKGLIEKHCKIIQINVDRNNYLIAVISNKEYLLNHMFLKIIRIHNKVEEEIGQIFINLIQYSGNLAQGICINDDLTKEYWATIEKEILSTGSYIFEKHILSPLISDNIKENFSILSEEIVRIERIIGGR